MAAPDYTDMYNTQLDPATEQAFLQWAQKAGRGNDSYDYDLRGAYKAGIAQKPDGKGHLPDTYKKPNHPTFSSESQYSTDTSPGGEWVQDGKKWVFKASPINLLFHGAPALQDYFKQNEPGNTLVLPMAIPQ